MNRSLDKPLDLFFDQLRDIHSVESQVACTLPDLSRLATFAGLSGLLSEQAALTLQQKIRVAGIFERHGRKPGNDESKGIKGLIEGGNEHLALVEDDQVRDLMLIAHYSRMKYYEIAAYHFATTLAGSLGYTGEMETLAAIWEEERDSAQALHSMTATIFSLE
jgi:ferritin-like metal-binding protein YciE